SKAAQALGIVVPLHPKRLADEVIEGCEARGRLKINLPRRQFLHLAAGAAAVPAISRIAWGQTYPTKPVTLIVPFSAGGSPDVVARILSPRLSELLGQQVIVENVGGAAGMNGVSRVAKAAPDGYQLVLGTLGTIVINQTLFKNQPYNSATDLTPVIPWALAQWRISAAAGYHLLRSP